MVVDDLTGRLRIRYNGKILSMLEIFFFSDDDLLCTWGFLGFIFKSCVSDFILIYLFFFHLLLFNFSFSSCVIYF